MNGNCNSVFLYLRVWTPKKVSAMLPFLKYDIRHGDLSENQQVYFLNLSGDIGPKTTSDIQHGYF